MTDVVEIRTGGAVVVKLPANAEVIEARTGDSVVLLQVSEFSAVLGKTGPQGPSGPHAYGSYYDTTTQTIAAAGANTRVNINTVAEQLGVTLDNGGRITFHTPGVYSMTFSIQFENTGSQTARASVWLKYQGQNYPASASHFDVPGKHGSINGSVVGTVNFVASALGNGDYVEVWWTAESTSVVMSTVAAYDGIPQSPAIILTVVPVIYSQTIV